MFAPDLGANTMCFPPTPTPRPVFSGTSSGREAGQSHSGARSGGLAQLPARPPLLLTAGRPHRGDPPTSTGRAQTQRTSHHTCQGSTCSTAHHTLPPSPADLQKGKQDTHTVPHPERFPASGDCLTGSFLPLRVPAGPAQPPPATAGVGGDHKLSLLQADASHSQGKAPTDPREASCRALPAPGLGGQLCQLKSHLCFNSSSVWSELAPNPLPLSPAGTRNRPLLGNH